MTFPEPPIPSLADQPGPSGTWKAYQTSPIGGFMVWQGGDDLRDRLENQQHDEGSWSTGPGATMTWIPTPTTSEDTP